ncbi:glycosyltransferase family 2 protein [Clostridium tagluense]|uniref:glycosyltransferase family 2 protein n=1 Tax=Clostridium tagluense TaxID=360422 RepID=UPI001C6ED9FE|nr:glycosyltransferase family 2 protein [Clostridium tagluense]MBW9157002.1 glycosyltransferase family 2 protein [Clostridium tagluense]WLC64989.1 glycosyltransferase family 2 protein [Clostridium tagluense]
MAKLSIIIPVYYNEPNMKILYKDLQEKVLCKLQEYEIVMVDDGSGDGSWEEMKKLYEMDNNIKLIKLSRNFGSHAAMLAGYLNCTGDCSVVKAADLQEPSELILDMFESWKKGNRVVLAVRSDREEGFFQKMFSNIYYWTIRKFAVRTMPKGGFDCFLIDRKVIEVLRLFDEKNSAITLQILWAGFKTDKIYYVRKAREIGKSRWTLAKKIKLVIDSMMGFSYFPIKFISGVGVAIFIGTCIYATYLLISSLLFGISVPGFATLAILILIAFGTIMLTLGILGEYIWRGFDAARNRPPYIIDEVVDKKIDNK